MSSLNWKPKTAPGQGGLLPPLNQQAEKGVPELAGGLRPTAQGTGLLVRSGGVPRRQETAQGVSWCCPALPCDYGQWQTTYGPIQGRLEPQALQERRSGLPHQVNNCDHLRCLLKAKGMWKGWWNEELYIPAGATELVTETGLPLSRASPPHFVMDVSVCVCRYIH